MAKGFFLPTFESIREDYHAEQILTAFGYRVENRKCICPFHDDNDPSLFVNKNYVHCFGCNESWDNFSLAKGLLEKKRGKPVHVSQVFAWFMDTKFETVKHSYNKTSKYIGPVPPYFIDYWVDQMTDEKYEILSSERLISAENLKRYKIGWRPDWEAWAIPFYRGEVGNSEVDIVQFRMTNSTTKYLGMKNHNRGSVMNSFLLEDQQPYLVVLFGSFDAILALQDGIIAVGLTGSTAFGKKGHDRVKNLFSKQKHIFIVPDNTPSEFSPAYKLAEILGAEVRFFDTDSPANLDYIDYRKSHTPQDFLQTVIGIEPLTKVPDLSNVIELLKHGDPLKLSEHHLNFIAEGVPATDVARVLAKEGIPGLNVVQWEDIRGRLWNVRDVPSLLESFETIRSVVYNNNGGW